MKHLDRRYRTRYQMSPVENLLDIKASGVRKFLRRERSKWLCLACGGTICVHSGCCTACGKAKTFTL